MKLGFALGAITAGNMLFWFLFQGYVFSTGGPGADTDAFFASLALPQLIMLIANSSLMHVLVPFFASEKDDDVRRDAWSLLMLLGGAFGVLTAVLYVSAPWWVPIVVIGFSESAKTLTIDLTRIQLVGMMFAGLSSVLLSVCHARHRFLRAEFAPFVSTGAAFAALIWIYPHYGVTGAAWLSTVRSLLMVALLLPALGLPRRPDMTAVKSIWQKLKPLLLTSSYYKSDQLVDRFLSSMAQAGTLSVFYFTQQAYMAANAILGKAIAAPVVPRLAALAKEAKWDDFHALYRRRLVIITLVAVAGWLFLVLFGEPILGLLGHYKRIEPQHTTQMWLLLVILGGIMVGGLSGLILAESFFAMGDTSTPARVLAAAFTLGIAMKVGGFAGFGVKGLAAATSLYFFTYPAVMAWLLERRLARLRAAGHGMAADAQAARQST